MEEVLEGGGGGSRRWEGVLEGGVRGFRRGWEVLERGGGVKGCIGVRGGSGGCRGF